MFNTLFAIELHRGGFCLRFLNLTGKVFQYELQLNLPKKRIAWPASVSFAFIVVNYFSPGAETVLNSRKFRSVQSLIPLENVALLFLDCLRITALYYLNLLTGDLGPHPHTCIFVQFYVVN